MSSPLARETQSAAANPSSNARPLSLEDLDGFEIDLRLCSIDDCRRRSGMLGRFKPAPGSEPVLCAVYAAPDDLANLQFFEVRLEQSRIVQRFTVDPAALTAYLDAAEERVRVLDDLSVQAPGLAEAASKALILSLSAIEREQNAVVRFVDSTLYDALKVGASDIHLEQQRSALHVRYRIDGVLHLAKSVEGGAQLAEQAISRIKVLAELDISERRIPQDGRFRISHAGRQIDLRVSIMPNLFGEDAVLRVLDRRHLTGTDDALTLGQLGFDEATIGFVRRASRLPYGLLLVTGPTGSGKTTTLYAALSEAFSSQDKIITIEDPVEYQLAGILQIPVNEKKGLTFARGLRSVLRHDPDKIMVGEIRDAETAQIAVQAALTGHQVLTTVHANNALDVIGRFINMGVDTYSLVSALSGVVAQRLVRTLCPRCAHPSTLAIPPDVLSEIVAIGLGPVQPREAAGCPHCRGSGYRGRRAIAETLPFDDAIRDLLIERASMARIKQHVTEQGFRRLRAAALALVASGATTLDEADRVAPRELA